MRMFIQVMLVMLGLAVKARRGDANIKASIRTSAAVPIPKIGVILQRGQAMSSY